MNELFVNIKVDREERPDIDAIYMRALHALGEQGGWPLTMFLDSRRRARSGAAPISRRTPRYGRPGFADVLREVARIYREEPDKVSHNAGLLLQALGANASSAGAGAIIERRRARRSHPAAWSAPSTRRHGGLTGAPKFPQWSFFWLLWRGAIRYGADEPPRRAVDITLDQHLPGRHLRSSRRRLRALLGRRALARAALREDALRQRAAHRPDDARSAARPATPLYARRIDETVDWLLREMIAEGGGFAASLDADTEGEEGKFYVWSQAEIDEVLGAADAKLFADVYDVTPAGNWEGHTILNRLHIARASRHADEEAARRDARQAAGAPRRPHPPRLGRQGAGRLERPDDRRARPRRRVFERAEWLEAAERAFAFVVTRMEKDGRLLHSYRAGQAKAPATASDYANMIWGALRLHQATNDAAYLAARRALVRRARPALLGRRRRLRLHRRRHRRSHRAHARRPRRRHAQRQRRS